MIKRYIGVKLKNKGDIWELKETDHLYYCINNKDIRFYLSPLAILHDAELGYIKEIENE